MKSRSRESVILYRKGLDAKSYLDSPAHWLDKTRCEVSLQELMHPNGLRCPDCSSKNRVFYGTVSGELTRYRCKDCGRTYTVLSGTVFNRSMFGPREIVLFFWLLALGSSDAAMAMALNCTPPTIKHMRARVEAYREK